MRNTAIKNNPDLTFINGTSYQTGPDANSVDIVVCSQSFHQIEPFETLKEIDRILKPAGIFAVLDCDWPVTISKDSELAYNKLFKTVDQLHERYKDKLPIERKWPKGKHLGNLNKSRCFSYCKEIQFDNCEKCDARRFINIALSQGQLQTLLKNKVNEITEEIEKFENIVKQDIQTEKDMYVSYKLIIGMKQSYKSFSNDNLFDTRQESFLPSHSTLGIFQSYVYVKYPDNRTENMT